jgi:hypothetical protein
VDATNEDPASVGVFARVLSSAVNNATPTVVFQAFDVTDGTAANPAEGATWRIKFELRNYSVS